MAPAAAKSSAMRRFIDADFRPGSILNRLVQKFTIDLRTKRPDRRNILLVLAGDGSGDRQAPCSRRIEGAIGARGIEQGHAIGAARVIQRAEARR